MAYNAIQPNCKSKTKHSLVWQPYDATEFDRYAEVVATERRCQTVLGLASVPNAYNSQLWPDAAVFYAASSLQSEQLHLSSQKNVNVTIEDKGNGK